MEEAQESVVRKVWHVAWWLGMTILCHSEKHHAVLRSKRKEAEELTRISRILVAFFRAICVIRVSILSCSPAQFLSSSLVDGVMRL